MTIIMITKRSIMKWTNILRCCEYCFVERLFGNAGRDKDTGTPMHAPFERNRLTMSVFSISTGFQAAWCVVALSVTIPLCLFFSPVVSIPLFVVVTHDLARIRSPVWGRDADTQCSSWL